jgi:hypothetical protein
VSAISSLGVVLQQIIDRQCMHPLWVPMKDSNMTSLPGVARKSDASPFIDGTRVAVTILMSWPLVRDIISYPQVHESGAFCFCTKHPPCLHWDAQVYSQLCLTVLTISTDRCLIISLQRRVGNGRNRNTFTGIVSTRTDTCFCHFGVLVTFKLCVCHNR